MIKVAVCDDNDKQREVIVHIVGKDLKLKNQNYKIVPFRSGEQLVDLALDFDIYFLDIQMNKLTGIEVAKKIRLENERAVIIFITGYRDYVFDAFDVRAFHYILKPIDEGKFREILHRALLQLEKKDKFIIVKTISHSTKIFLKDIMYFESEQRKIRVHTTYDIIEYYHKLSDIEKELGEYNFFRCHKSYIVNLSYVQSFDNTVITLKNSEKVYVSKYRLANFSKAFMYYLKDED